MNKLEPQELRDRVNKLKFPPTLWQDTGDPEIVWEDGWIYGVWYCGTAFQRAVLHGQYPMTFVKRIRAMFPPEEVNFLHLCCGVEFIRAATNVDMVDRRGLVEVPTDIEFVKADVEHLPKKWTNSYDVVLIDPPYSEEDASRYGVPRLINARNTIDECYRVLRPGGWLLWLDEKVPNTPKDEWNWLGIIGIITGRNRRARWLAMFRKSQ